MQGVMSTWMGWNSTPKRTSTPKPEESDSENDSDSDFNDSNARDKKSASDHSDVSDITFASLDASYDDTRRRTKAKQLDKSFAILTDHIKDNDLDMSAFKDINHEFGMNDSDDSIDLSKTPFDEVKTGSLDESKTSLVENWNKKFDEWRTPKKELFLAKLMKTINMTEEWMKAHSGVIIPLTKFNPAAGGHPEEQHRSSINGRVVDDHQIRHPTAPKAEPAPTTERDPFSRHNKNSLSNDSLAFTLVYCSVFLVTLFYIGYKLTKKWRNQDELEATGGTVHLVGANGYVCNHTLCREARLRNQALYGSVEGPHNTARCDNSCEFCKRLNQPPPSYSKLNLEETEPPAYNEEMDRQCVCRRSQNSRASLCLYQSSGDTSQEAQDLQRSASEAIIINTTAGSPPRPESSSSDPNAPAANLTSVTVHPAPSYLMQPAPSYADFPKPGEMKTAGHTRGSMENIPNGIINTPRVIHHPIFTVDEEDSDDESITVHTPMLSSNNSLTENTTTTNTSNNANINNTTVSITNELMPSAPYASSENVVNNVLTTIVNNAVTNIEDSALGINNWKEESKQTTANQNGGKSTNKDDIVTADTNSEAVAVGSAPQAAECVNATSSVENSSIIIEKSR